MRIAPVFGDLLARRHPNLVVPAHMFEEPDQTGDAARPANQPIMQRQRHQLRSRRTLGVQRVEAIAHVASKMIAG